MSECEFTVAELLGILDEARAPVLGASEDGEFSFDEVREPLQRAFALLGGDLDVLAERSLNNARLVPFAIASLASLNISRLAQTAISDDSAELERELLRRSRALVTMLERRLLGAERPVTGGNVVAFGPRARTATNNNPDGDAA